MTNTQHTPGPWMRRTPRGENAVMAEDGCFIAVVYTGPEDARLIAAAPDLLEALQDLLTSDLILWLPPWPLEGDLQKGLPPWSAALKPVGEAVLAARAAIAKATGQ